MTNSITRKAYLAGAAALATAALPWPLAAQTPPVLKVGTGKSRKPRHITLSTRAFSPVSDSMSTWKH